MIEKYYHTLKQYWGFDAFRELQLEAINSISSGNDTLVLMPTGGGKSIIYQVPTLSNEGLCLVVTPLIALMKDQIDKLRSKRILAESIHSGMSPRDIDRILDNCIYGDVKFLYVAPERIDSDIFKARFAKMNISLIAIDEAHCISQWGYDFRPAYLKIKRLRALQPDVPMLALTASATPKVVDDIMLHLDFSKPKVMSMSFARNNLSYIVRPVEDKNEHLMRVINNVGGAGIVYARTRANCEMVADNLRKEGIEAQHYHGGMGHLMRSIAQDNWIKGATKVIVATNAFGMGIDKADVRFVVHYDIPDSLEAYYQEAGRAGRDGKQAYAVLLLAPDDISRAQRRMMLEFPSIENIKNIYELLCNYLQIGIGEGKGYATIFNIYEFSAKAKLFTPTVESAIKILQQNRYLTLTDEVENPTRIKFVVRRDDLYRIRVDHRELDHIITTILRHYTGLFSDFTAIREDEVAQLSGYTVEHIETLFKSLRQLHIIKYIPGCKSPLIIMNEERLPMQDLRISPESYAFRLEIAKKRFEATVNYVTSNDECRSAMIQHYFGEKEVEPCGICDLCRARKKAGIPLIIKQEQNEKLKNKICDTLSETPLNLRALASKFSCNIDTLLENITSLLAEGKIVEDKGGSYRLNR